MSKHYNDPPGFQPGRIRIPQNGLTVPRTPDGKYPVYGLPSAQSAVLTKYDTGETRTQKRRRQRKALSKGRGE